MTFEAFGRKRCHLLFLQLALQDTPVTNQVRTDMNADSRLSNDGLLLLHERDDNDDESIRAGSFALMLEN
jgi:hypothetical protein